MATIDQSKDLLLVLISKHPFEQSHCRAVASYLKVLWPEFIHIAHSTQGRSGGMFPQENFRHSEITSGVISTPQIQYVLQLLANRITAVVIDNTV